MKERIKKLVVAVLTAEAKKTLNRRRPRIVAITGTVGKTTTKDAIAATLALFFSVRKSEKSFNSDFGVPLTILGLKTGGGNPLLWLKNMLIGAFRAFFSFGEYPEWLVLEVGAGEPGDIPRFGNLLSPDVAVITHFSDVPVHVEYFTSPEAIVEEKTALALAVREGGIVVLGVDDAQAANIKARVPRRHVVTYGVGEGKEVRGLHYAVQYEKDGTSPRLPSGFSFSVQVGGVAFPISVKHLLGEHFMEPFLAAFAVASALRLNLLELPRAFRDLGSSRGRMHLVAGVNHSLLIDDSYNASPVAVAAALKTLHALETNGRKIAILGDMAELGTFSAKAHRDIGAHAARSSHTLLLVGALAQGIREGALAAGMKREQIRSFGTSVEAGNAFRSEARAGDIILIKGSQSVRMERAVKALMAEPARAGELLVRQEADWLQK